MANEPDGRSEEDRETDEMIIEQVRRFNAHGMKAVPHAVLWAAVALERSIRTSQATQRLLYKGRLTVDEIPEDGNLDSAMLRVPEGRESPIE
jgi:hypothetical protein